jgi:hypothetical protein
LAYSDAKLFDAKPIPVASDMRIAAPEYDKIQGVSGGGSNVSTFGAARTHKLIRTLESEH